MLTAQLAAFLVAHHHAIWATKISGSSHMWSIAYQWAVRKGFVYQP
jgi:hypothetical protein